MRRTVRQDMGLTLVAVLLGVSLAARAQTPGDLTGVYTKKGGDLSILQGDNETLVFYEAVFPQGQSVGTCGCSFVVRSKSANRWTLREAEGEWSLRIEPKKLVLEGSGLNCCGAGWPGSDTFTRAQVKAPQACKVKAPRAYFHDSDEANTRRKAFVVAGDTVEALVPAAATEVDKVPARFKGPRKSTVGLVELGQLECAPRGTTASAGAAPVKAEQLQPFAGQWVELTKKGKGYVISKPCSAETRGFTLQPTTARLELQLGQESTTLKVTDVRPGSGTDAWVLELTQEGGTPEQVDWKVTHAGKGLVTLDSPGLFPGKPTYVRADKKGAFPVEAEKGCDEYE